MPIPVPVGREYTATLKRVAWIPVDCQRCGCEYEFELSIETESRGHSILWLDNEGASDRALDGAVKKSISALRKSVKRHWPASCPQCGALQPNMVGPWRFAAIRERLGQAVLLAVIFLVVLALVMGFTETASAALQAFVAGALTAGWLFSMVLMFRFTLRYRPGRGTLPTRMRTDASLVDPLTQWMRQ